MQLRMIFRRLVRIRALRLCFSHPYSIRYTFTWLLRRRVPVYDTYSTGCPSVAVFRDTIYRDVPPRRVKKIRMESRFAILLLQIQGDVHDVVSLHDRDDFIENRDQRDRLWQRSDTRHEAEAREKTARDREDRMSGDLLIELTIDFRPDQIQQILCSSLRRNWDRKALMHDRVRRVVLAHAHARVLQRQDVLTALATRHFDCFALVHHFLYFISLSVADYFFCSPLSPISILLSSCS